MVGNDKHNTLHDINHIGNRYLMPMRVIHVLGVLYEKYPNKYWVNVLPANF
jgi:hypothetical protein